MGNEETDDGVVGGGRGGGRGGRGGGDELVENRGVGLCDASDSTRNREDTLVDARHDFGDTSFDASVLTEVSNVFALLSYDDTGITGADEGTEGERLA
jgi:hypothetical protein